MLVPESVVMIPTLAMSKVPCLLYLERKDAVGALDFSALPFQLDPAILGHRFSMAQ